MCGVKLYALPDFTGFSDARRCAMSAPVVEFAGVSKRYVIRHASTGYLKDRLTNAIRRINPFSRAPQGKNATTEDFWALRDVSFGIQPGESVGIIGANGSGKSTTLKILAGVTEQTSGRVAVNGKIGALIEVGAGFHPELSGRENVFLNGSILGMKKAEIAKNFDSIVEFADVEQFIDTPVKHYSSGMYVRLGFAIAVHNDPEILLVDEVLAVGDLSFQRKCFDRMRELQKSGRTFILISHSMSQIQSLCDRAIMLQRGRLIADGSPTEVTEIYNQQQGQREESTRLPGVRSKLDIRILRTTLMDANGNTIVSAKPGQSIVFEIEYDARDPLANAIGWVHLGRGGVRVLDSDTDSLGIELGTLKGRGTLRCELPGLALMPNAYDVQVGIFDERREMHAHAWYPHMLSISRHGSLAEMGCAWVPESYQRGIIYSQAKWNISSRIDPGTDTCIGKPPSTAQLEGVRIDTKS
jgi:ABC-type polysaccharide/polyol phosphate transport system ATPase subunit